MVKRHFFPFLLCHLLTFHNTSFVNSLLISSDLSWWGARGLGERQVGARSALVAVMWLWKMFEGDSFFDTTSHCCTCGVSSPGVSFSLPNATPCADPSPLLRPPPSSWSWEGSKVTSSVLSLTLSLALYVFMSVYLFYSLSLSLMNISLVHIRLSQAPGVSSKHFSFFMDRGGSVPHSSSLSLFVGP